MSETLPRSRRPATVLLLLSSLPALAGQAVTPDADELLRRADAVQHPLDEGRTRIRAVVQDSGREPVVSELDVYVKGPERVLCVFRTGRFEGRRILIRNDLRKVWLLVPGVSRAVPITANQILLGGASIADVARQRLPGHYDAVVRPETESVDGVACWVLDLTARSPETTYASAVWWIGDGDELPRRARLSLRSGKVAKEIRFLGYDDTEHGSRLRRMEIDHLLRKERGMVTTLEFLGFDERPLDPETFEIEGARGLP